jgi:hypothetical protein
MIGTYQMAFINLISSLLVLGGALFYRFIFPKKKINLFVLLLVILVLPIISVFRAGDYESGDFNIHIYRMMSFYSSLKEGLFVPSWAADLNATYGNPLFIFNYSLPYYLICFLHLLGVSFITGTKLFLGLSLYISGIFMYFFVNKITKHKLAAFTAGIFYAFAPYHLIDVHFRATLGESAIFTIVPLLFLFIFKYHEENKFIYLLMISLLTAIMISAHPVLAIVFLCIAFLYLLLLEIPAGKFKSIMLSTASLVIGGVTTVYLWVPYILYSPYMFKLPTPPNSHVIFYNFSLLFYSPWRLGFLFQGPKGELAMIIGYTQILVVILLSILALKDKLSKKIRLFSIFWLGLFFLFVFLMSPASTIFWGIFPSSFSGMLILYGRLSLVLVFCTALIASNFTLAFSNTQRKKAFIFLILVITVGYTLLNWGQRRVILEINDTSLVRNVPFSTVNEGTTAYFLNTKWADPNHFWFTSLPKQHFEIISGNASVKETRRTSIEHDYIINAKTPLTVRENTLYYPGWSLVDNNKSLPIYPGERGVINFKLPEGLQNIELRYDDLPLYKFSKAVSVVLFLSELSILGLYLVLALFRSKPKHFSG